MKSFYYQILICLLFTLSISACKIDAPIYPKSATAVADTTVTPPADTVIVTPPDTTINTPPDSTITNPPDSTVTTPPDSTNTFPANTGDGLPVGAINTISIQLVNGGAIKTYSTFVNATYAAGATSIRSVESLSSEITIDILGKGIGTFSLGALDNESGTMVPLSGRAKITEYNFDTTNMNGTIKGTFSADMKDSTGKIYQHVIGSFNIKQ